MKRLTLRILVCISFLLFLTSATLWLRSLWYRTNLTWSETPADPLAASDSTNIELNNGLLHFHTARYGVPRQRAPFRFNFSDLSFAGDSEEESRSRWQWTPDRLRNGWNMAAFGQSGFSGSNPNSRFATPTLPLYFPALLFTLPPAIALHRHLRRRHRMRNNLCPSCGYDLRASPEKCPECGTVSPSTPSTFGVRS